MSVKLERRAVALIAIAAPALLLLAAHAIPAAVDLLYSLGCTTGDVQAITAGLFVSFITGGMAYMHRHNTKLDEAKKAKAANPQATPQEPANP